MFRRLSICATCCDAGFAVFEIRASEDASYIPPYISKLTKKVKLTETISLSKSNLTNPLSALLTSVNLSSELTSSFKGVCGVFLNHVVLCLPSTTSSLASMARCTVDL